MTAQQFHDAYIGCAQQVSAGTGIDPVVLLSQWANETAWGTVVVGYNLGNIRDTPTSFARYNSLTGFAQACIATFTAPDLQWAYGGVLAARGAAAQLAAIVASPWSSGHYGGSLQSFYAPLEALSEVLDINDPIVQQIYSDLALIMNRVTATDVNVRDLYFALGMPSSNPTDPTQAKSAVLEGIKAQIAAIPSGGQAAPEPAEPTEPIVDLTPLTNAVQALTADVLALQNKISGLTLRIV